MSDAQHIFDLQKTAFGRCTPLTLEKRLEALDLLLQSIVNNQHDLIAAVSADFGHRTATETRILEIFPLIDEIRFIKRHLRRWMRPSRVAPNWQFRPSRARILYQPVGVVGIIGAWNYPILLTLSPLSNALAAGNHVIIKPSELAPNTAGVIQRIIGEAFPEEYVAVVTGGKDVASTLSALPFDHILFTGSQNVGKLVMKAAAENLTPVTLELGGKSPALVHESFSMATAADRICSAKFWNAGQTCIAPDYALVPTQKLDEFISHCKASIAKRFPYPLSNTDYTHMISESAYDRMQQLVEDARSKAAHIIQPAPSNTKTNAESRSFPPTLIVAADDSMRVMQEEIFGPILPIITFRSLDDALNFISARPHPLALYYFDTNQSRTEKVLAQTSSGGACINDCIFHFVQHRLPFGGAGPSGMGAYHGLEGFKTFSRRKGVYLQNSLVGSFLDALFKPPYTRRTERAIALLTGRTKASPIRRIALPSPPEPPTTAAP